MIKDTYDVANSICSTFSQGFPRHKKRWYTNQLPRNTEPWLWLCDVDHFPRDLACTTLPLWPWPRDLDPATTTLTPPAAGTACRSCSAPTWRTWSTAATGRTSASSTSSTSAARRSTSCACTAASFSTSSRSYVVQSDRAESSPRSVARSSRENRNVPASRFLLEEGSNLIA